MAYVIGRYIFFRLAVHNLPIPIFSRPVRTSSSLRSKPTQVLPDGTIVVPIGSEDDDEIVEPVTDQDHR